MKLILLRHGHDLPANGGGNCLSTQGRKKVAETALRMSETNIRTVDIAFCSPTRRARETLEEVQRKIDVTEVVHSAGLFPESSPLEVDQLLMARRHFDGSTCLVVGHEPQLSSCVLRWCGLVDTRDSDGAPPEWMLARGEGYVLSPTLVNGCIDVSYPVIRFLGSPRPMPNRSENQRASSF